MLKCEIKIINYSFCESSIKTEMEESINNLLKDIHKKGYTFKDLKIIPYEDNKLFMIMILYDDNAKCKDNNIKYKHKTRITKEQAKYYKDTIYDSRIPICLRDLFIDMLNDSEVIDDDEIDIKHLLDSTLEPTMRLVHEKL